MAKAAAPATSTLYTREFVRSHLPRGASRVVEIGCGAGEVAAMLIADGLQVVALDADGEAVAAARNAGVDARRVSWPADLGETFDAVLFTRSLHHVHDLDGSIAAARPALAPGGRLIIEDFRAEGASDRSASWYTSLAELLAATGLVDADRGELVEKIAPDDHGHALHSSTEIARALVIFASVRSSDAAYFFRHFEPYLTRADAAAKLLDHELALIAEDCIDALGKRFVASG